MSDDNNAKKSTTAAKGEGGGESSASTKKEEPGLPHTAVVHPLVLLSVVDHYARVAKDTEKRVVGVLLGESFKGEVDISNCYAVPFEEDPKDSSIWFLDHNYHEQMHTMFKKVNARENVVGWYSTGPKVRASDLAINEMFRQYTPNPVFVIIDPTKKDALSLPTQAYISVEEVSETHDGAAKANNTFQHIDSVIGALEAEEVGVEHLLRDIRRLTNQTLAGEVEARGTALKSLAEHIEKLQDYLSDVRSGKLPLSQRILAQMQDIFNLAPAVTRPPLGSAFASTSNDMMLMIYVSSLVRSVISLHNLLLNKRQLKEDEKREVARENAEEEAKDGKKTDGDKKDDATDAMDTDK